MKGYCAQNVSFQTLYSGQFTLSTQSKILNYPVILSHWCSTTFSLEIYPLYLHSSPALKTSKQEKNSSVLISFSDYCHCSCIRDPVLPIFCCLTTDNRLAGSLLGFLYVTIRWGSYYFVYEYQFDQTVSLFLNWQIQYQWKFIVKSLENMDIDVNPLIPMSD